MNTIRIAIDASSAAAGGGITYLNSIVPRLEEYGVIVGPLLVRTDAIAALEPLISEYPFVDPITCHSRLGAMGSKWHSIVRRSNARVVFVPTDISLLPYNVPTVLALRQACLDLDTVWEYGFAERKKWQLKRLLARASVHNARSYIAISQYAHAVGVGSLGVSPEQIVTIYHGGPSGPPSPPTNWRPSREFLFVSNLYRYKNLHRLLRAFSLLPTDSTLVVAGAALESAYFGEISELIAALDLSSRVRFLGHRSRADLLLWYRSADCFVWPSYAETFGHPLIEAHHQGLPILAADIPSNREIMGGAASYFQPLDIDSIHGALMAAWLGEYTEPRPLPRPYSWEDTARNTANHFKALVDVD